MRAESSKGYCAGLGTCIRCVRSKACASVCALLREGQTHREAGAQSQGASYGWEVAGLLNRAVEEGGRMRPSSSEVYHAELALHSSS
jgi:hypothetical protein